MIISKKILSLILVTTLFTAFFVACEETSREDILSRHKRNVVIGGYSLLAAYSAKNIGDSLINIINWRMFHLRGGYDFFEYNPSMQSIYSGAYFCNIIRLSLHGFLMYFSMKNIIQELRNQDQDQEEKKDKKR